MRRIREREKLSKCVTVYEMSVEWVWIVDGLSDKSPLERGEK